MRTAVEDSSKEGRLASESDDDQNGGVSGQGPKESEGDDWGHTARHLSSMVMLTLQMEEKRCSSLRGLAGTLLTCSSIVSVALLTVAAPLFQFYSSMGTPSTVLLLTFYFMSLLSLVLSILFSILSQLRFSYEALPSPEKIREAIADGTPFGELEAATHEADSLDNIYGSLEKKNDTMRNLLKASTICAIVSIGVILIGGIYLSVHALLFLIS